MHDFGEKSEFFVEKYFQKMKEKQKKNQQSVLDFRSVLMYNLLVRFYAITQYPGGVSNYAEITE